MAARREVWPASIRRLTGEASGVHGIETILFLVVLGTVVAAFAGRLRVPAPSLLVIAGLVIGLLPRFPPVHVPPDVVSLVVLPPLLYQTVIFLLESVVFSLIGLQLPTLIGDLSRAEAWPAGRRSRTA
jgi:NhaP-type Na+/H+ or K+/H+ antiporter